MQHRPITAYELGDPHATYRAVVLGSMHGYYERAGETVTRALRTASIPVGLDLWVIDTLNPDGDALGQRTNAHGVDLNRNWPNLWIPISRAGCTAFDCHYSGPRALSEPETVAMYAFLNRVKPNRLVSMHQPLDGVDTTDGGATDTAFRNALAHNLNLPLKAFTCYSVCHGSMTGLADPLHLDHGHHRRVHPDRFVGLPLRTGGARDRVRPDGQRARSPGPLRFDRRRDRTRDRCNGRREHRHDHR